MIYLAEKLQAELKLKQKGARSMCPCTKESVLLILINCDSRSRGNVSFRINEDKLIRKCNTIYYSFEDKKRDIANFIINNFAIITRKFINRINDL